MSSLETHAERDFAQLAQAAEELSTLGYPDASRLLWTSAFAALNTGAEQRTAGAALAAEIRQLLAEQPAAAAGADPASATRWIEWQERARKLAAACVPPEERSALPSRSRVSVAVGASIFATALVAFAFRTETLTAFSSADFTPAFAAPRVCDGDETTEWLLPDHQQGFIDVTPYRRRAINAVTLTNGFNAPYLDRATRTAKVLVFDDDRLVDSAEVSFTGIQSDPLTQQVALRGEHATRVRIEVVEHFGLGAALAEVSLE